MKFKNPYWSNKTRIELLQRWLVVQSIIYYEMNKSIVTDKVFDANCKQLLELKKKDSEAFRASSYYKTFKDFDGNTGFDLFPKLRKYDKIESRKLLRIAEYVAKQFGG